MDTFYVQPEKVAKSYGIEVVFDGSLPEELYGYGEIDENGRGKIVCNSNIGELRARFTVSHILGHFLLGHFAKKQTKKFVENHQNFDFDAPLMEDEASRFAAQLLVPKDKLEFLIFKKDISCPKEMAAILKVSENVLVYMLHQYQFLS